MKILFVQTPTSHLGAGEKVYPLGLSRLSGLAGCTHEKNAIDMNIEPDPWLALSEKLKDYMPDICVLSFRNIDPLAGHHASYVSSLRTAAKIVRKMLPGCRIIAGGPAFSIFAKRLMEEIPEIDFGIIGAGEPVFMDLIDEKISSRKIPGTIRREKNKLIYNTVKAVCNINNLPELDTILFKPEDYIKGNKYVAAMGIEGKRGCDLTCGYCMYPCIGGKGFQLRDVKLIADEMEQLKKEHGIELFHFTDSVVNRPYKHFNDLCSEIIRRKIDIKWTGFFREDTFTPESLNLAIKAGLSAVYFSADALTESGLKLLDKRLGKNDIFNAARISAQSGILTMCHFLVNLPYEDKSFEEAKDTVNQLLDIHQKAGNLGAVIFNNIRLYPGAPITQMLMADGILNKKTDLLYPVYYNPPEYSHMLHEFETICHEAGVFSRLGL